MALFVVCPRCDRGQVYCGEEHRAAGRLASRRRSNARHQASVEGSADHCDRNRAFRSRQRAISSHVTGHTANNLPSATTFSAAESTPAVMSTSSAPRPAGDQIDAEYDGEIVGGADANATTDHAGREGHRESSPANGLERAPARDGDAARGTVALGGRAPLCCAVCGRAVHFVVRTRPPRRARRRRRSLFYEVGVAARIWGRERSDEQRGLHLPGVDFRDLRELGWGCSR